MAVMVMLVNGFSIVRQACERLIYLREMGVELRISGLCSIPITYHRSDRRHVGSQRISPSPNTAYTKASSCAVIGGLSVSA